MKKFNELEIKVIKEYLCYSAGDYTEAEIEKEIADYIESNADASIYNVVMDIERKLNPNLKYFEDYYNSVEQGLRPLLEKYNIKEEKVTVEELREIPVCDVSDLPF